MKTLKNLALCTLVLALSSNALAQTIYTDRASFETANPGLATEDFENGNVSANDVIACDGPLDDTGDGVCFGPGDLLPGVAYTTTKTDKTDEIALLGAGFSGALSRNIVANFFVESFVMDFDQPDNTAVGMDLVCYTADTVSIDIYGAGGLLTSESS